MNAGDLDDIQAIPQRVADLLSRMTVDEKIGQLCQITGWQGYERTADGITLTDEMQESLRQGNGCIYGLRRADPWTGVTLETGLTADEAITLTNTMQRFVRDQTRLGIPLLFTEECAHGVMTVGATVFPAPIALGSTWNPALLQRVARTIAREATAIGAKMTLSPVLDVARDARWGRTEETLGEDPYLGSQLGVALVKGFQQENLADPSSLAVCLKHFGGHGGSEGGHNSAPLHAGMRELYSYHLPPFRQAVAAGALGVMAAYHSIDGIPCHGNRTLLTDILRNEWGFDGVVTSDGGGVPLLATHNRVAADLPEARATALAAGVNLDLTWEPCADDYRVAIERGLIAPEVLDQAVAHILTVKFRLGLFDAPEIPREQGRVFAHPAHRQLALDAAREAMVLLKNDAVLPLPKTLTRVAVIGPNADTPYNQLGDYTGPQARARVVTVLDGVREALGPNAQVRYARGCGVTDPSTDGFADALDAARHAEVAIVVMGTSSSRYAAGATYNTATGAMAVTEDTLVEMDCAEGLDTATLQLSGVQMPLLQQLHDTGTPIILVLINGRPVETAWMQQHIPAILEAWYPGQLGGTAVADVLFGDYNPGGKLPLTFPQTVGQLPLFYNALPGARPDYCNQSIQPAYPFGYGLSYTTFAYAQVRVTPEEIPATGAAVVRVEVTNTGALAGDEVVQLYLRDDIAAVCRPDRELHGFTRAHLQPGETRTIEFSVNAEHLRYLNQAMQWVVDPGTFTVMVGGNSVETLTARLVVVD